MDFGGLILVARGVHVLGGVVWAGFVLLAWVIMPALAKQPDQAKLVPRLTGPAALLTLLSGIYLMATLHPGDTSNTGLALKVGALAAVLSIVVGAALIGPRSNKLLRAARGEIALDPQLRGRLQTTLSFATKLNTVLMLIAVLAMATARYL
ncbi:hypothetical protein [Roseiterribacter gracilis]|uniref:Uncharacterized protein n=1 Tax=Roseiterribacter gracilis TaxID=2812848 RepID=A0A8S8X959_9PROT|nr:hypothetical protein TMPK1_15110 [Rhodospirillales bacterium TMPK1]